MLRIPIIDAQTDQGFPPVHMALREPNGLLCAGGDLSEKRLLLAYRSGLFPWFSEGEPVLWWSPDPRLVFETKSLRPNRRMRRWLRSCAWSISADHAFTRVVRECAAPRAGQSGTWITPEMFAAYEKLHRHSHAHSIEVWEGAVAASELVGGMYGVAIGKMFFAESMFSRQSNGSKVALLALAAQLRHWEWPLIDAQVESEHLLQLGATTLPRPDFVERITDLCARQGHIGQWSQTSDDSEPFRPNRAQQLADCV